MKTSFHSNAFLSPLGKRHLRHSSFGCCLISFSLFALVANQSVEAANFTWTGTSSNKWETPANWGGTAPDTSNGAVVTTTAGLGFPLIDSTSGTVAAKDLTINSGATVTQTGGILQIPHDWKNAGTFNATGGTVTFTGNAGKGGTFAGATLNQFFNLTVNSGVTPGFSADANSQIKIGGDFTNNNSAAAAETTNSTFTFNGTGAQAISVASANNNFGNLVINKASGAVTLSTNAKVAGTTTITSGALNIGGNTLTITASGLSVASGGTLTGTGSVTGGTTTISGTLAPGNAGTGTLGLGNTAFTGTSVFEWQLGAGGSSYDKVTAGAVSGTGGIFKIVNADAFTDTFWSTNHTWTGVLSGTGSTLESLFTTFGGSGVDSSGNVTAVGYQGKFSLSGNSVVYNTGAFVPEPTSALAGLLLTAGLLRRRRQGYAGQGRRRA